jgi:hypothetical protein
VESGTALQPRHRERCHAFNRALPQNLRGRNRISKGKGPQQCVEKKLVRESSV